jgi:hypothetical protein
VDGKVADFMLTIEQALLSRPPPLYTHHSAHTGTGMSAPFTHDELLAAISSAKPWSAPGSDGIPYALIQAAPLLFHELLLGVFNSALHSSYFPSQWKKPITIPIKKFPHPASHPDCRPISLLATL